MKTASIGGKASSDATLNSFSRLMLCIAFLHPLWCEAQQTGVRQKPKAPPMQIGQPAVASRPAASQALNQAAAPAALQQGANQVGTQAAGTPVAGDVTRASTAPASAQTQLPPVKNQVVFSDRMGGMVYSTGAEDIHLWILPNARGPRPLAKSSGRTLAPGSIAVFILYHPDLSDSLVPTFQAM
jgi:hypothetical protein